MKRNVLVVAGGSPDTMPFSGLFIKKWDRIIAVDHGGDWLAREKIPAHSVIGDLDSLSEPGLQFHQTHGALISRFPAHKDESDLELALRSLPEEPENEVHLCGLWGGRFDHSCMNLLVLGRHLHKGLFTFPTPDGFGGVFGPGRLSLQLPSETPVALIALASRSEGITSTGVQWPLREETLELGESRGISNTVSQPPWDISLKKGALLFLATGVSRVTTETEWHPLPADTHLDR